MNWGADASGRYERWRWQWLASHDSRALATFRWHGLAATLALTAARPAPAPGCRAPLGWRGTGRLGPDRRG